MTHDTPQARRQARLARTSMIRRRVVTGALALFVATWMFIALVLISGRDPALAAHSSSSVTTLAGGTSSASPSTSGDDSGQSGSSTAAAPTTAGSPSQSAPSAIVTRAS